MIRTFDFILSSLAILVLLPILLPVMLILACTGEHHAFYLQTRIGQGGRPFSVFKFATMLLNSPNLPGGSSPRPGTPGCCPSGGCSGRRRSTSFPSSSTCGWGR